MYKSKQFLVLCLLYRAILDLPFFDIDKDAVIGCLDGSCVKRIFKNRFRDFLRHPDFAWHNLSSEG